MGPGRKVVTRDPKEEGVCEGVEGRGRTWGIGIDNYISGN